VLPLGSELWLLYFDATSNGYAPKCVGTVTRTQGSRVLAGNRWHELKYPYFTSKAAADAYVAEHPFSAPSIK